MKRPLAQDLGRELEALQDNCSEDLLQQLSQHLGLPLDAIRRLQPGWADEPALRRLRAGWNGDPPLGAWAFAERDGGGRLIGLSLRAPDARKNSPSGLKRGLVVPSSLRELPDPVLVVEGASDVVACLALGTPAIGRPSNRAGASDIARMLEGRQFVVLGENDPKPDGSWPGRDGAKSVASRIAATLGESVKWSMPPGDEKDVRSWLLARIAEGLDLNDPAAVRAVRERFLQGIKTGAREAKPTKASTADRLVDLAHQLFTLGRSQDNRAFAVPIDGPHIALPLRDSRESLRRTLSREYKRRIGKVPNSSAIADALVALEGEAMEAEVQPLELRVAETPPNDDEEQMVGICAGVVIDLGRSDGQVIVARPYGWRLVDVSPVLFRRTELTGEMPIPENGGDLSDLGSLLNCDDSSWPVLIGWLISTFIPDIPHPILMLGGRQGTGKSTAAKIITSIVDPSPAPLRSEPRDTEAWAVMAAGSWLIVIDNVSTIRHWWSDALCKVVTGDGLVRRQLYTDSGLAVLSFQRCVLLTSIDAGALRGDLADRLVQVELDPIPDERRRTDSELKALLRSLRPRLLGALLDLLVRVLAELPNVELDGMPRMADFARILAALDQAAPELTGGRALQLYLGQRNQIAETVIDSDIVAEAIHELVQRETEWQGTSGELSDHLVEQLKQSERSIPKDWPRNGQAMTARLKRLMPALETVGIEILIPRRRTKQGRIITIKPSVSSDSAGQRLSPLPPSSPNAVADAAKTITGDEPCSTDSENEHQNRHLGDAVSGLGSGKGNEGDNGDDLDQVVLDHPELAGMPDHVKRVAASAERHFGPLSVTVTPKSRRNGDAVDPPTGGWGDSVSHQSGEQPN